MLAGGGHAHLAVLEDWARVPLPGCECILITPNRRMIYSGMLPGWIEGLYRRDELEIDLAALAAGAGVRLILDEVAALDAERRRVTLASGMCLDYDIVSLAIGGDLDAAHLGGVNAMLPIRPMETFLDRWSAIERAEPQRIAVVGGGAAGTELALAFASRPGRGGKAAKVSLIAGSAGLLAGHAQAVRNRARAALEKRGVDLIEIDAVAGPHGLSLSDRGRDNGPVLADVVVAATGRRPPLWLKDTGLMLGPDGGIAIGADLRSVSHTSVWAAGDVSERLDHALARSGVHAVKSGPVLAANLRSAIAGGRMHRYEPRSRTLYLLATGKCRAILTWGGLSLEGAWVWRLKNWIDRRFVVRYQRMSAGLAALRGARNEGQIG